jgi:transposase
MARRHRRNDPKLDALREHGILNPCPERVVDPLFSGSEFFDPRDLVQVKYEMVRRVEIDGASVTDAAAAFGFSRPSFYGAQKAVREGGLTGLLPKKRGPHGGHKLNAEIIAFIEELQSEVRVPVAELVRRVEDRFGIRVHCRSIERAVARRKKKR